MVIPNDPKVIFESFLSLECMIKYKGGYMLIYLAVVWSIWKAHNDVVLGKK